MQDLKKLALAIKSFHNDDGQAEKLLQKLYEDGFDSGYKKGHNDEKIMKMRIKFRYRVLLGWLIDQLDKFSSYTKRYEYKMLVDDIQYSMDEFMMDNNLGSCYRPKKQKIEGEDVDFIADISSFLPDVVTNFQKKEDERLEKSKAAPLNLKTNLFE